MQCLPLPLPRALWAGLGLGLPLIVDQRGGRAGDRRLEPAAKQARRRNGTGDALCTCHTRFTRCYHTRRGSRAEKSTTLRHTAPASTVLLESALPSYTYPTSSHPPRHSNSMAGSDAVDSADSAPGSTSAPTPTTTSTPRTWAGRFKKWLKTPSPAHVLVIAVLGSAGGSLERQRRSSSVHLLALTRTSSMQPPPPSFPHRRRSRESARVDLDSPRLGFKRLRQTYRTTHHVLLSLSPPSFLLSFTGTPSRDPNHPRIRLRLVLQAESRAHRCSCSCSCCRRRCRLPSPSRSCCRRRTMPDPSGLQTRGGGRDGGQDV